MMELYAPLRLEAPGPWLFSTETFGMGKYKAEALARKLESSPASEILIYGSSGALRSEMKPGDTYFISEIVGQAEPIKVKQKYQGPTAKLFTSPVIVANPNEKKDLSMNLGADLVDMEMGFLWMASSAKLREKYIFVRGVLDASGHELDFKKAMTWLRLPSQILSYQRGMKKFLNNHIFRR